MPIATPRTRLSRQRSSKSRTTPRRPARAKPARPTVPPRPTFGITRIDHKTTHGYFVRLGFRMTKSGRRPRFVTFFADLRHGGKRRALAAAQAWVRHVFRTGKPPADQPSRAGRLGSSVRG